MKDFESFVKTYSTRDFIYFFSQKSIEIYKEHIHSSKKFGCSMMFPLESFQYGFFRRTTNVMLLAWDMNKSENRHWENRSFTVNHLLLLRRKEKSLR